MRAFANFLIRCLLVVTLIASHAYAAPALPPVPPYVVPNVVPNVVPTGELGLEGIVQSIDGATGQITIAASAFATSSGRKAIEPTKPKLLITTNATRFYDERTGRARGQRRGTGSPRGWR